MGHHINDKGQFQSDKHPDLAPDKITLSFKDPAARAALAVYAMLSRDQELNEDIAARLSTINKGSGPIRIVWESHRMIYVATPVRHKEV